MSLSVSLSLSLSLSLSPFSLALSEPEGCAVIHTAGKRGFRLDCAKKMVVMSVETTLGRHGWSTVRSHKLSNCGSFLEFLCSPLCGDEPQVESARRGRRD